jgi:hypothetical protein
VLNTNQIRTIYFLPKQSKIKYTETPLKAKLIKARSYFEKTYSPFCVPAKVIRSVGLTSPPLLSPTNLIIFAGAQNGE